MCCSTVLFDCKCIHISKTLQRILCPDAKDGKKTRIVIDTPKSKSSNRVVPLSDFLFEKLSAHRSDDPETYVLTGKEKYMEPRVFEYHFDKLMRECALQDVHFHTLRHPYVKPTTKKFLSFFKFEMAISLRAFLCFALLLGIKEGPQLVPFIR